MVYGLHGGAIKVFSKLYTLDLSLLSVVDWVKDINSLSFQKSYTLAVEKCPKLLNFSKILTRYGKNKIKYALKKIYSYINDFIMHRGKCFNVKIYKKNVEWNL